MELEIGGTYEIVSEIGVRFVVRVNANGGGKYQVLVLEKDDEQFKFEYIGFIWKNGDLLKNSKITRLDKPLKELVELQQAYGDNKPKKRRTKEEIIVDDLIEHVQRNIKIQELEELIDMALASKNEDAFKSLSKEYAKLKKKVSA